MKTVKKYLCFCCKEVKSSCNVRYRVIDEDLPAGESPVVGICRKCDHAVERAGHVGAGQYMDALGLEMDLTIPLVTFHVEHS